MLVVPAAWRYSPESFAPRVLARHGSRAFTITSIGLYTAVFHPCRSFTTKPGSSSSIVQGGGKRRSAISSSPTTIRSGRLRSEFQSHQCKSRHPHPFAPHLFAGVPSQLAAGLAPTLVLTVTVITFRSFSAMRWNRQNILRCLSRRLASLVRIIVFA